MQVERHVIKNLTTAVDTVTITMDEAESYLLIRSLRLGYAQVRHFESDGNDRFRDLSEFTRSLCEQLSQKVGVLPGLGEATERTKPPSFAKFLAGRVITDAIDVAIAAHEAKRSSVDELRDLKIGEMKLRIAQRQTEIDQHIIDVVAGDIESKGKIPAALDGINASKTQQAAS